MTTDNMNIRNINAIIFTENIRPIENNLGLIELLFYSNKFNKITIIANSLTFSLYNKYCDGRPIDVVNQDSSSTATIISELIKAHLVFSFPSKFKIIKIILNNISNNKRILFITPGAIRKPSGFFKDGINDVDNHLSKEIGSTVDCEFVGDSIKWVGAKFDDAGKALVEIDSEKIAIVDQYDPTRGQPFAWEHKGLGPGKHTFRLTIIEDKNPKSRDHWINIKRLDWLTRISSFDAKTIAPKLMDNSGSNSIVALEVNNINGKKVNLLDFDSAGETGKGYTTWFQIDNVRKCVFTRKNPLRSCR